MEAVGSTSAEASPEAALAYYARACELDFMAGCLNVLDPSGAARADPKVLDLRLLLREGGLNLMSASEAELRARACEHGWASMCSRTAQRISPAGSAPRRGEDA